MVGAPLFSKKIFFADFFAETPPNICGMKELLRLRGLKMLFGGPGSTFVELGQDKG